jgi:cytochrome oxidase Cu insertion factor (SCO1/SenC/PrrC family)
MKNTALVFWIALAVVGSAAYGSWVAWRGMHPEPPRHHAETAHEQYRPAPPEGIPVSDFQLVERSGREIDSKELKGDVWLGSFFFSSCPGKCWQMNQAIEGVLADISDPELRSVSISCDPENDTPEALRKYADRLHADPSRWLFFTGNFDYIQRIGLDVFKQNVERANHTFHALLFDREGKIVSSYDMLDPEKIAELKAKIKVLLAEKKPEKSKDQESASVDDKATPAPAAKTDDDGKPQT